MEVQDPFHHNPILEVMSKLEDSMEMEDSPQDKAGLIYRLLPDDISMAHLDEAAFDIQGAMADLAEEGAGIDIETVAGASFRHGFVVALMTMGKMETSV